jgi:hypothetical protein
MDYMARNAMSHVNPFFLSLAQKKTLVSLPSL